MTRRVLALGPTGFGPHEFDPTTGALTACEGNATNLFIPGFVDVHFHGAFGIDFMSASPEEMLRLCGQLEGQGYDAVLPTTVTASVMAVQRALSALPTHPLVPGFHLEGPFISPKYPGAQPQDAILDPPSGASEWDIVLDDPRLRLITLAPERPGAPALIERLYRRGVRVSMGHTDATYAEAQAGVEAGVRHATHTFNAMRPLHHREPGTVGLALSDDRVTCELIYDRLHVQNGAADVLFRCKGPDGVIAISDSTMASGLPAGQVLKMWGLDCVVGAGQVRLTDGTLAGSAITLYDAFRNLYEDFGPELAIRACCLNPARILGRDVKTWVELDDQLRVVERITIS